MILSDFGFIETDPDPTDQNETDPNGSGSGSATLFPFILNYYPSF